MTAQLSLKLPPDLRRSLEADARALGTVFFLVIVASADLLSCVPANVYGYAALVGYTLSAGKLDALTAADNSNPLFLIVISAILGAVLGYLMGQLAGVLKLRSSARSSA